MPTQGKRKSVAVVLRQFTGYCAPAASGVNCQTVMASGTVYSSATHAGKRTVSGPTCSNSSPRTQTWQRLCPTALLYAPICAQRAGQKGEGRQEQCPGRSRGGFSSKIHLLVDALVFPLKFILTGSERHDMSQAELLPAPFHFDAIIADKGYDSDPLRELLAAQQVEVVIPFRRYRKQPWDYDRVRYRERNIVERFINKIKWYRQTAWRWEIRTDSRRFLRPYERRPQSLA